MVGEDSGDLEEQERAAGDGREAAWGRGCRRVKGRGRTARSGECRREL